MIITKVVYVNLEYHKEWDLLQRMWLEIMGVPTYDILRFEGIDGKQFKTIESIQSAAADDGFPEFRDAGVPDWFGIGDLAVNWTHRRILREISRIPDHEVWFVILDDEFILHPYKTFQDILEKAENFDFIQFMHWNPGSIGDKEHWERLKYLSNQSDFPLTVCDFDNRLLSGGWARYPGDNANIYTASGASKLLSYMSENPHVFPEAMPTFYRDRDLSQWTIISPASENLNYWTKTCYRESYRKSVNNSEQLPNELESLKSFIENKGTLLGKHLKLLLSSKPK